MLSGKILKAQGWPEGKVIGLAKAAAQTLEDTGLERDAVLARLDDVRAHPDAYLDDPTLGALAAESARRARAAAEPPADTLRDAPLDYRVWGAEQIDPQALSQMANALRLPVSVAGALMPDAHVGYGLPIGGVLAAHEAVIPYAVCCLKKNPMRLSVYPQAPPALAPQPAPSTRALPSQTRSA